MSLECKPTYAWSKLHSESCGVQQEETPAWPIFQIKRFVLLISRPVSFEVLLSQQQSTPFFFVQQWILYDTFTDDNNNINNNNNYIIIFYFYYYYYNNINI